MDTTLKCHVFSFSLDTVLKGLYLPYSTFNILVNLSQLKTTQPFGNPCQLVKFLFIVHQGFTRFCLPSVYFSY